MSDFESVASEEDISIATDRSEAYDSHAIDYDVDNNQDDRQPWRRTRVTSSSRVVVPPLKSALVVKTPTSINTSADQSDDYGDYSEFVDDFETESVNSREHKAKKPSPRESLRASAAIAAVSVASNSTSGGVPSIPPSNMQSPRPSPGRHYVTSSQSSSVPLLPSGEGSGLAAEVMLDEISREVVRLRNQQRAVLQERRQAALGKKVRADERRAKHEEELKRLGAAAATADAEKQDLAERLREMKKKADAASKSYQLLTEANARLSADLLRLEGITASLTAELDVSRKALAASRTDLDNGRQQWLRERAELQAEVKRGELLQGVVQRSMETMEARLAQEKATLPLHQQKACEEAQARLSQLEAVLKDREGALLAEETRRLAAVDAVKREAAEQTQKHRMTVESDLAAERRELGQMRSQLEASRALWDTSKAQETAALESLRADLARKERDLDEARAAFARQSAELEAGQRLIEPNVRAAERDREDARALKAQADRVLFSAEEHASVVLAAERGLVRREQVIAATERGLETARGALVTERRALLAEAAKQRAAQQALDAERFRLHQCSQELSMQVTTVKRGVLQLVRGTERYGGKGPGRREKGGEGDGEGGARRENEDDNVNDNDSENEENRLVLSIASKQRLLPAALDPALIHTAVAMQDVSKALLSISAATEAQDPALDGLVLGPLGYGSSTRHEPAFDFSRPIYPDFSQPAPEYYPHEPMPPVPQVPPFEQTRSELNQARASDEVAVSSVRASVQQTVQSSKNLIAFATKFGSYLPGRN